MRKSTLNLLNSLLVRSFSIQPYLRTLLAPSSVIIFPWEHISNFMRDTTGRAGFILQPAVEATLPRAVSSTGGY